MLHLASVSLQEREEKEENAAELIKNNFYLQFPNYRVAVFEKGDIIRNRSGFI